MSKRLPMRKISEVLRLTKDGLTQREIAQSIGVSPTTVAEYTRRAVSAGISYPLPEGMGSLPTTNDSRTSNAGKPQLLRETQNSMPSRPSA